MAPPSASVASTVASVVSKGGVLSKTARVPRTSSQWIKNFNATLSASPQTSLGTFLLSRNISWYTLAALYSSSGAFSFLPELAVGYLVTKFTTKFRQPVNVGLAAVISRMFPVLTDINSKSLVGILSPSDIGIRSDNGCKDHDSPSSSSSILNSKHNFGRTLTNLTRSVEDAVNGPVNKYGFSLYLSSRITMVSSILGVTLLTHVGYDLSALLASYGVSDTVQATGSGLAAATLTNVLLLPFQLYHLPNMIDMVSNKFGRYTSLDPRELYLYILWKSTVRFRYFRMQSLMALRKYQH